MRRLSSTHLLGLGAALGLATIAVWVVRRDRALTGADGLWKDLVRTGGGTTFDPAEVASLPEPARRYLLHAIAPGTPIAASVELAMRGSMRLKPDAEDLPMRARQVLAPPRGLLWRAEVGEGLVRMRGFDAYDGRVGSMHWWLWGLVPVVDSSDSDVSRSAAGRLAGESVLFPPALLPRAGATWFAVGPDVAVARVQAGGRTHELRISVTPEGRPRSVSFPRWRTDRGTAALDTFVVDRFESELSAGGYTIPGRFRAGWRLGEPDEFPFFRAVIEAARFR